MSPRLSEIPFTAERKMMTTFHRSEGKNEYESFAKGAPEIVLNQCNRVLKEGQLLPLTEKIKDHIISINYKMAGEGFRVLALATKNGVQIDKILAEKDIKIIPTIIILCFWDLLGIQVSS